MYRWHVKDVETHGLNCRKTLDCRLETARCPSFGFGIKLCAFAAREELVPGAKPGTQSLAADDEFLAEGLERTNRLGSDQLCNLGGLRFGEASLGRALAVRQFLGQLHEGLGVCLRTARVGRGPGEQRDSLEHHQIFVDSGGDFYGCAVVPGVEVISKSPNLETVGANFFQLDLGVPSVAPRRTLVHSVNRGCAIWGDEQNLGSETVVTFAINSSAEGNNLTLESLGGECAAVNCGRDTLDWDASEGFGAHPSKIARFSSLDRTKNQK